MPGLLRSFLDRRAAAENDQISERDLFTSGLEALNSFWIFRAPSGPWPSRRAGSLPNPFAASGAGGPHSLRRACRNRGTTTPPPRRPRPVGNGQAGRENLGLQRSNVLLPYQFMIDCGNRVLPHLGFLRNQRTEIARERSHVAMRQLVPRPGEGIGELIGMFIEAPGNLFVCGVLAQREVGGQHRGRAALGLVERIGNGAGTHAIFRVSTDSHRRGSWSVPIRSRTDA